jgi:hypothetical protein
MIKQKKPRSEKQKQNDMKLSKVFKEKNFETKENLKILDKITSDPEYLKKPTTLKLWFKDVTITPEDYLIKNKKFKTLKKLRGF